MKNGSLIQRGMSLKRGTAPNPKFTNPRRSAPTPLHEGFCVDTTTRRALALGFPVILVDDAHTTEGNQHLSATQVIRHHNETLTNISTCGPRVGAISTENLRVGA